MNNTPTPSKNETAVRLYDEAQVFEGSRPSGLLIQGGDEILRLERELAAVTKERDRLAEALKQIQGVGLVAVDAFDEIDRIDEIVDEALQSLTQPTP